MKFEQIFYGRGPDGYCILGRSTENATLSSAVESVSQSIGNPVRMRDETNQPYLIQKIVGEFVLMGCGRDGERDSMGRRTQFYHFLVANRDDARAAGISAADLFRKGDVFVDGMPMGTIGAIEVDATVLAAGRSATEPKIKFPAVVSCLRDRNLEVLELLGNRAVDGDWVTFSWEPLTGCLVYGLDPWRSRLELSDEVMTYDITGCAFPRVIGPRKERPPEVKVVPEVRRPEVDVDQSGQTMSGFRWPLLVVALVVGLLLGFLVAQTSSADSPKLVNVPREELSTDDFDTSKLVIYGKKSEESRPLIKKLRDYVEFVNQNFFNNQ